MGARTDNSLLAVTTFRLAEGIRWRAWDDGIAVFIPSTCETHILSPELLPLFENGGDELPPDIVLPDDAKSEGRKSATIEAVNLGSLMRTLKIIE